MGTSMLEQLAGLDPERMSPDTARTLLQLKLDPADAERVTALSLKGQRGALSPDERAELDEYIRVGDALAVLQSRARRALKHLDPRA